MWNDNAMEYETTRPTLLYKTEDNALMPERKGMWEAGLDLKSSVDIVLQPDMSNPIMIDSGVAVAIPNGYVGIVFSRSSFAKHNIQLANSAGVIDSTYRGNIFMPMINRSHMPYRINKYDRIAQLVIMPVYFMATHKWEGTDDSWINTERGVKGFGSTGV